MYLPTNLGVRTEVRSKVLTVLPGEVAPSSIRPPRNVSARTSPRLSAGTFPVTVRKVDPSVLRAAAAIRAFDARKAAEGTPVKSTGRDPFLAETPSTGLTANRAQMTKQ